MKITIDAEVKELAALIVQIQGRQITSVSQERISKLIEELIIEECKRFSLSELLSK